MPIRRSNRRRTRALAAGLLLLLASAARAETRVVLPGVARAAGVGGSRFESVLWLHNPSDASLPVDLTLVSAAGPSGPVRVSLAPRETRRVEDPVASLFGLEYRPVASLLGGEGRI